MSARSVVRAQRDEVFLFTRPEQRVLFLAGMQSLKQPYGAQHYHLARCFEDGDSLTYISSISIASEYGRPMKQRP